MLNSLSAGKNQSRNPERCPVKQSKICPGML
jgi:hypothetical protein